MAKWRCTCGSEVRSSAPIPNPTEWLLIFDEGFDAFSGSPPAEDIYSAMTHAFRCPACDRLHVFWSGFDHDPTVYTADS